MIKKTLNLPQSSDKKFVPYEDVVNLSICPSFMDRNIQKEENGLSKDLNVPESFMPNSQLSLIKQHGNVIDIVNKRIFNRILGYSENVYKNGAKFVSFRKVALDMQAFVGENPLQLISFHSVSKGFLGECGFRGGYFELLGIPAEVKQEIYKLASI